MLGTLLVIISLLIVVAVLYGHQKRETFTNMKGSFPKWIDVVQLIRKILDEQFEYDIMKFTEMIEDQTKFNSMSADDINHFMNKPESKYLPKNFTLNVDLPFDSNMAIKYAERNFHIAEIKKPTDISKLSLAYIRYYQTIAFAESMKTEAIVRILAKCIQEKIILKLKEKSFSGL
jgi:hypothetical protein